MPDDSTSNSDLLGKLENEVRDLRDKVIRVDTRQDVQDHNIQGLTNRIDSLERAMNGGFDRVTTLIKKMNDWRTWAAFCVVVGATSIGNAIWHLIVAFTK